MTPIIKIAAHTPGPWTVEPGDKGDESIGMAGYAPTVFCGNPNGEDDGVVLATLHEPIYQNDEEGYPLYWGDIEANARLMAAAPDLLAALKGMFNLVNAFDPAKATAAIDAATAAIARAEGEQ